MPLLPSAPALPVAHPAQVARHLRTGDILLFAGRGLVSDTVRVFTRSHWSHIGMVVHLPGVPGPLVLEATTLSESNDVFRGAPVRGIGLVPFACKVQEYPGEVALRQRVGPALDETQEKLLRRLVKRLRHRPYKNYLFCHLRGLLTGRERGDYDAMFCSELVAELYRRVGWLEKNVAPRRYVPGSFAAPGFFLQNGFLAAPVMLTARPVINPVATHDAPLPAAVRA